MGWFSKKVRILVISLAVCVGFAYADNPCNNVLPTGYMPYGGNYKIGVSEANPAIAYIPFMQNATFHVVFCSANIKKYRIELFDIEKKLLFSTVCDNYRTQCDVTFNNPVACYAVVTIVNSQIREGSIEIAIAYKETMKVEAKKKKE